jgi:hypothetical protein
MVPRLLPHHTASQSNHTQARVARQPTPLILSPQEVFAEVAPIEKIVFVEPKKLEGSDMPINPFSVGRKNAIIHFPGISEATNALATLHNFEIDGVQVRLCPCCAPAPRAPPIAVEALVRNVTSVSCASRFASIFHPVRRKKAHRAPQTSRLMYVFFVTKFLFCTQPRRAFDL